MSDLGRDNFGCGGGGCGYGFSILPMEAVGNGGEGKIEGFGGGGKAKINKWQRYHHWLYIVLVFLY